MTRTRRFVMFVLPVLVMSVAMFIASAQEGMTPPDLGFNWQDKVYHAAFYALYGLLVRRAIMTGSTRHVRMITLMIGILWALSDEWHQSFVPGRTAEWGDVIADAIGVCASLLLPSSSWVLSAPSASSAE